jgi:hypothetical protein
LLVSQSQLIVEDEKLAVMTQKMKEKVAVCEVFDPVFIIEASWMIVPGMASATSSSVLKRKGEVKGCVRKSNCSH